MSKQIADALAKLVGDKNAPAEVEIENYQTRPAAVQTRGLNAPPPDQKYGIVSPLTEVSRVTTPVTIWDDTNQWSVTVDVATQITMTDANGTEFVFDYAAP
jgi:hypothetical protein